MLPLGKQQEMLTSLSPTSKRLAGKQTPTSRPWAAHTHS
jgi:hypothetical protein